MRRLVAALLVLPLAAAEPARLVVDLSVADDPAEVREGDERPAQVRLDFPALVRAAGLAGTPDLATLRVFAVDGEGRPRAGAKSAYARHPHDVPVRWDDERLADATDSVEATVNDKTGELRRTAMPNTLLIHNVAAAPAGRGRLVWTHTRRGAGPTTYRLEVALTAPGATAGELPRSWIGDGVVRFTTSPHDTTGSSHTHIDVADWDGDGLVDIVYGENYGRLFVLRNRGTRTVPAFGAGEFLLDEEGRPLDAGITAAPLVTDWDGDGRADLLVGAHWNRALFFKNTAPRGSLPRYAYRGFVRVGDGPLALPFAPVVGRPAGAFTRDYYPQMVRFDWDGDGAPDLVAGGYVTGRIFVLRHTGRAADGTPVLAAPEPIEADGTVLNVGDWAAAPHFADLDGDCLADLVSGSHPMAPESVARREPLRFFRNTGTRTAPRFTAIPPPIDGELARGSVPTPRLVDLDGDGLLDLVVSAHASIHWLKNTGTKTAPSFRAPGELVRPAQGNMPLHPSQWLDWDGDGRVDLVTGYTVARNSGAGDPFLFEAPQPILARGQHIEHPSRIGDDWFFPRVADFTGPGRRDILFGDWHGQIWLHRRGAGGRHDDAGELLRLEGGAPIKVGPIGLDPQKSFLALQGARTVFATADVMGDGRLDLVVGDTYGDVRFFRNTGTAAAPVFREAQKLGSLGTRLSVDFIDWNDDGAPDVIAGSANGRVRVFLARPGEPPERRFAEGIDPKLPPIVQPRILAADLNGDGDTDLFLPGTQGSVWLERSFLRHGYARATVGAVRAGP